MADIRPVLVTGGTGNLGRAVVRTLVDAAVPTRVLSRRPASPHVPEPVQWAIGDLLTGEGLDDALADVSAVVNCATDPRQRRDVEATTRLLIAARAARVPHLVHISIVGVDTVPYPYYAVKRQVEDLIEHGGVPWTILRATQFHDFVDTVLGMLTVGPVTVIPAGMQDQPVDVREVAARLVELAAAGPSGRATDMGGPEVLELAELVRQRDAALGRRGVVWAAPLPGATAAAFRAGGHLTPEHADGRITYAQHLARRRA
ncbi:SDR family oxidoreductase [Cellulomonas chengniuliangii]|uniref:NAD(P)H-binding protein n=1 Tax=Cellulomonas chengniuliangii TaxID=2968084 RepID=A0ABY5L0I0_9CELL|nr:NAD(P)H-binding protein [Cellulomonas chengniuliangii]MCC2307847.1 NAD(P)H-binding protein [Cellulomonas chengniuliangii]MCC2318364.1 NAD(P)H-binding protein [Cellulomonas chengniuliangii]UUI75399.1 NAD(P)H-binding protein [Cellulomonas chengniuliangii]